MRTDFDAKTFKDVMGSFPTGVAVITAIHDGAPVGFTCQSFADPDLAARLRQGALAAAARFTPDVRASALQALYAQVQSCGS